MNRIISNEDLYKLRKMVAKEMSIDARADDYARQEREDHYFDYISFVGDLITKYEIPEGEGINARTGEISEAEV